MPKESAMLSATAITSNEPITPALGLTEDSSPKIIHRLVTVDDVAPKLNLLGSLGNFTEFHPTVYLIPKNLCYKK
jgi:hypothetical protein